MDEEIFSVEEINVETDKGEETKPAFDMSKLDKKSLEILEESEDDEVKFKLNDFEGPLDLLVHLIKITKINIRDIFLSDITEQYLEYMKGIDEIDVDKASEFLSMSATLLEIKSQYLLPRDDEVVDEDSPEEQLYRKIEEYKLFKEQSEKLSKIEDVGKFYKEPDDTVGEFKYELPDKLSVDALIRAFSEVMQKMTIKAEAVQEKKIEKDRFTVAQKITEIKDRLLTSSSFKFSDLFGEEWSRSEVINTFLALLELLKRQYITVKQENIYDNIEIIRNEEMSSKLNEDLGSEYDEK